MITATQVEYIKTVKSHIKNLKNNGRGEGDDLFIKILLRAFNERDRAFNEQDRAFKERDRAFCLSR